MSTEQEVKEVVEKTENGNSKGEPEMLPGALSDYRRQSVINLFDEKCIKAARLDEQIITVGGVKKKYKYRPIYSGERNKLTAIEERRAVAVRDVVEFIQRKKKGENVEKFSDVDNELNEAMANYFLVDEKGKGMTKEDYAKTVFEEINPILQGYALRTEKPLPPLGPTEKKV